jgi:mono/diheme cytochrome c family protein
MKTYFGLLLFLLAGCANTTPPRVTAEMAARNTNERVTVAQLQHGRVLFASRCIECHTLPPIGAHNESEWPRLINTMANRASLNCQEREAVLAYILAVRQMERSYPVDYF